MSEICPRCSLPLEICVCQEIAKQDQKIKVSIVKKRFGKISTIVEGFDVKTDVKQLAKELKRKLACGGTGKDNRIELQGDHRDRIRDILKKMNYAAVEVA